MTIRLATPSDEPAMASLLAKAFFDESLFGQVMHPYRDQYPDDVKIFWSEYLRKHWKITNERLFVATTTVDGREKVAGVAIWRRDGDDEGKRRVESEWVDVGKCLCNTSNQTSMLTALQAQMSSSPFPQPRIVL
jgi:hypothetical protein